MRLALIVASLRSGGAERVMSVMANHWAGGGESVALLTLSPRGADFYQVDPRIARVALGLERESSNPLGALRNNFRRIKALTGALRQFGPDVVVSFGDTTNVLAILSARRARVRCVVSERTDPACHRIGRPWVALRRWTYPRADAIVVQSETVRRWMSSFVPLERLHVIPNPVRAMLPAERVTPHPLFSEMPGPKVVSLGRLSPEKGFDLLLAAFARCIQRFPEWRLLVFGDGPARPRLQEQLGQLGLEGRALLPGKIEVVEQALRFADLFVCPSRYEGFPNALCEAMACGLPVVSFDCPSGPREILQHGRNGLLVPAEDAVRLAQTMQELMASKDARQRLGVAAHEVCERFSLSRVMGRWLDLLQSGGAPPAPGRGDPAPGARTTTV